MSAAHMPVLLDEVMEALAPGPGDVIVDATFGAGGYTRAFLDAGATVHAFDRDPDAVAAGSAWPETRQEPPRLVLHPRRFSEMVAALAEAGQVMRVAKGRDVRYVAPARSAIASRLLLLGLAARS